LTSVSNRTSNKVKVKVSFSKRLVQHLTTLAIRTQLDNKFHKNKSKNLFIFVFIKRIVFNNIW